jgi:acyl-CoA thioester hydrolase
MASRLRGADQLEPFELSFTAEPEHIDELGHVNNAVWVRWIQEMATTHWREVASPEQVAAYIWVVTRHEIDYLRPLKLGETAVAKTWVPDAPKGARFDRVVEFVGADGKPLVKARTTWAMIEQSSGRPARVPPELASRFLRPSA